MTTNDPRNRKPAGLRSTKSTAKRPPAPPPPPPPADPPPPAVGLECPRCGCRHFYVGNTVPHTHYIKRSRICRHCGKRITTIERPITT